MSSNEIKFKLTYTSEEVANDSLIHFFPIGEDVSEEYVISKLKEDLDYYDAFEENSMINRRVIVEVFRDQIGIINLIDIDLYDDEELMADLYMINPNIVEDFCTHWLNRKTDFFMHLVHDTKPAKV